MAGFNISEFECGWNNPVLTFMLILKEIMVLKKIVTTNYRRGKISPGKPLSLYLMQIHLYASTAQWSAIYSYEKNTISCTEFGGKLI